MENWEIHIPARKKQPISEQAVVKLTPEAYNTLVDIYNESTLSLKQIAKYIVSAKAIDGSQLYKSLCTIRDRYNVRFEFCEKKDTGSEIIRILSGDIK